LTSILPDIKYDDIIKKPLKREYFISKINSVLDTSTVHFDSDQIRDQQEARLVNDQP